MKVGLAGLGALLSRNVVELKFNRRHEKLGWSSRRRMLCTNDLRLLNSMPGHIALNYRQPTHPPSYPATQKNLIVAWDILWQDFRMINCDSVDVISVIPTEPADAFWQYFSESLAGMPPNSKIAFMNA